jgi:hypothetical protein
MNQEDTLYQKEFTDSSFLKKVIWDRSNETLIVLFSTGSIWGYYNVPFEIYENLLAAESHGRYFNLNIRNMFEAEKLGYLSSQETVFN